MNESMKVKGKKSKVKGKKHSMFTRVLVATGALPKAPNGQISCARDKKRRGPKGQVATETLVLVSAIHV